MILDGIILILSVLAFARGWRKGLLWAIGSLIAILIGVFVSLKLSQEVADFLFQQNLLTSKYTLLISFVLLFLLSIWCFRLLIKFVEKVLDKVFLGWVNNLLGGLLYSFFAVFLVSVFCWLANGVGILNSNIKKDSKTYVYVEPIASKTIQLASDYLPMCKTLWSDVKGYFEKIKTH